jgi:hypothetical protein
MKTINELKKVTNSLQSMIIMNDTETNMPVIGAFLTTFYHTDRRSEKIIKIDNNKFTVENGNDYFISKKGIQFLDWQGKKITLKNARITNSDLSYTDPSF